MVSQQTFTCSKSTIETLDKKSEYVHRIGPEYVHS